LSLEKHHPPAPIKEKPNPEENCKGRRKKRLSNKVPKENPAGRKRIFKPALFHHFHSAADIVKSWRFIIGER
jgi:hypothetical protein